MNHLSIGEVARQAGIRTSAIRYYESIGVIPAPARVSGRRRYAPDVLRQLAFIRMAQEVGCSLDEIRAMFEGLDDGVAASDQWRALAESRIRDIDAQIDRAHAVRRVLQESLRCDCVTLDGCELLASA